MEQWRTVVTDNGEVWEEYEVSNLGHVRSLNYHRTGEIRLLKQTIETNGYLTVGLRKNGKTKKYLVHRLVAFTWIENDNPTIKTQVNHKNEIKTDCRVENLEWCSPKYNTQYGTGMERRAEKCINDPKRSKRVRCVETGIIYPSIGEASRQTGLLRSSISACCLGKRYKTCGGLHWEFVK